MGSQRQTPATRQVHLGTGRRFGDLRRRLGPLARFAPRRALPWKRREWERAHQIVAEVYELMEGEVEPSLPEAEPGPLAIEATVGDDGEVTDVSVIE